VTDDAFEPQRTAEARDLRGAIQQMREQSAQSAAPLDALFQEGAPEPGAFRRAGSGRARRRQAAGDQAHSAGWQRYAGE
jgi:hypothetical protein